MRQRAHQHTTVQQPKGKRAETGALDNSKRAIARLKYCKKYKGRALEQCHSRRDRGRQITTRRKIIQGVGLTQSPTDGTNRTKGMPPSTNKRAHMQQAGREQPKEKDREQRPGIDSTASHKSQARRGSHSAYLIRVGNIYSLFLLNLRI